MFLFDLLLQCFFMLCNCFVVLLMCQYLVNDGMLDIWYLVYLGSCVVGGVVLVISEVIVVLVQGCILFGDIGIWNCVQQEVWVLIIVFIKVQGVIVGIQLVYVGCKVSVQCLWEGGGVLFVEVGVWSMVVLLLIVFDVGWYVFDVFDQVGIDQVVVDFCVVVECVLVVGF